MVPQELSILGKTSLIFRVCVFVVPAGLLNIVTATIRAWLQRLSIRACIRNAVARALMTHVPADQIQAVLPSTIKTYRAWVASAGKSPLIQILPDGTTRLLWLESRKGTKVLLFFHGGGYIMPLSPGHLDWMDHVKTKASEACIELDICVLEYSLAPDNPYPKQMTQAILAFKHLLACEYSPSNIIFGGDSAGGHLSLSLLSHLYRPRPAEEKTGDLKINLSDPVKGCFLVSPLASFQLTTRSYAEKFSVHVLSRAIVSKCGEYLVHQSPWNQEISQGNGWGMALDVPEKWWEGMNVVDWILVTAGQEEAFRDHVLQLVDVFRRSSRAEKLEWLVSVDEAHDEPLMDFWEKRQLLSATTVRVTEWVIQCFS